jgi:hypothetical protein
MREDEVVMVQEAKSPARATFADAPQTPHQRDHPIPFTPF